MSLMNKLSQVAKSPKGQELLGKAKHIANDPKNRAKLEEAKGKLGEQIDAAKHKLAEKRGEDKPAATDQEAPATSTSSTDDDRPTAA